MSNPPDPAVQSVNPYQSPRVELTDLVSRQEWPRWVRIGLWKIRTRAMAWIYLGVSLLLLAASAGAAFWPGLIFLAAVYWYWEAIRWVDEYGSWG